jgi:hypothetical protein
LPCPLLEKRRRGGKKKGGAQEEGRKPGGHSSRVAAQELQPDCSPWRREAQRKRGRPDLAVPELELLRAPWKPALLRKDADAVYPEDRSASAAMDALNVDHHLFGRMPER